MEYLFPKQGPGIPDIGNSDSRPWKEMRAKNIPILRRHDPIYSKYFTVPPSGEPSIAGRKLFE